MASDKPTEPVDPVGVQILEHLLIRDKMTGQVLVNKNGADAGSATGDNCNFSFKLSHNHSLR